eukprot:5902001-Amphidinium_carterae.1
MSTHALLSSTSLFADSLAHCSTRKLGHQNETDQTKHLEVLRNSTSNKKNYFRQAWSLTAGGRIALCRVWASHPPSGKGATGWFSCGDLDGGGLTTPQGSECGRVAQLFDRGLSQTAPYLHHLLLVTHLPRAYICTA